MIEDIKPDEMIHVEDFLRANGISFVLHEHAPVFTGEELEQLAIPGLTAKNLFCEIRKARGFCW
jgi:hypothetical protein